MKRYQVKEGFSVHGERGVLLGPDTFPEDWLPPDHLEDLLAAGFVTEVIEEPPVAPGGDRNARAGTAGKEREIMITIYMVAKGNSVAANGHGAHNIAARTFKEDERIPDHYIETMDQEQLVRLLKAGTIQKVEVDRDPGAVDSRPREYRVGHGHHLSGRRAQFKEREVIDSETLEEMGPHRLRELLADGTITEKVIEEGGAA